MKFKVGDEVLFHILNDATIDAEVMLLIKGQGAYIIGNRDGIRYYAKEFELTSVNRLSEDNPNTTFKREL